MNAKVKKEALACIALLHRQIGPGLKSLAVSLAKQSSTKEQFQKCFEENPFEPSLSSATWPKVSFVGKVNRRIGNGESIQSLVLDIPTFDLFSTLPADIISKLVGLCLVVADFCEYLLTHFIIVCEIRVPRKAKLLGKCVKKHLTKLRQVSKIVVDFLILLLLK